MREVHIGSIQNKLVGNTCPSCGRSAEGGTSIDDKEAAANPKPGDLAVCLFCGGLNVYTENLTLRKIERTERRRMLHDPRLKELFELLTKLAQERRREWQ